MNRKDAARLFRQMRDAAVERGYEGKATDADAIDSYLDELGVEVNHAGKAIKAKMLVNVLGGTLELQPAEESVETDAMDDEDEEKVGLNDDDDEEKGKALRRATAKASTTTARRTLDFSGKAGHTARYNAGKSYFDSAEKVEVFGALFRQRCAPQLGSRYQDLYEQYKSKGFAKHDSEILSHYGVKSNNTVDPAFGASLVAEAFDTALVVIKDDHGMARQLCDLVTGFEQIHNYTVDGDDPEANWITEGNAIPESESKFEPQQVQANKLIALGFSSMELFLKPAVQIGDKVAEKMYRSITRKEDLAFINGDGGGTFGGITGLKKRLLDLDANPANIDGIHIGGTSWGALEIEDLQALIGIITKADENRLGWYCSKRFFANVIQPLATKAGGTTRTEIQGKFAPTFEGYPVYFDHSGALDRVSTTDSIPLFFGDFALSAKMLEVSGSARFDVSEHNRFDTDEVGFRYREQVGINVHGQGTADESGSYAALYINS